MLQWQAVFVLLLLEMFICMIVILPLPLSYRKAILEAIDKLTKHQTVSTILKVVLVILVFLFVDSVRASTKVEEVLHTHEGDPHHPHFSEGYSRMFRNQRNAYAPSSFTISLVNLMIIDISLGSHCSSSS